MTTISAIKPRILRIPLEYPTLSGKEGTPDEEIASCEAIS